MFDVIADRARAGYLNEGRGAMIIDLSHAPEVGGGYLSISRLLIELGTVPDETLEQTLNAYNAETEFVAVVRRSDQSLHGYILRY
jgi:membrane-bound lytic murein transglycosylase